jgi:hypothetical protein
MDPLTRSCTSAISSKLCGFRRIADGVRSANRALQSEIALGEAATWSFREQLLETASGRHAPGILIAPVHANCCASREGARQHDHGGDVQPPAAQLHEVEISHRSAPFEGRTVRRFGCN